MFDLPPPKDENIGKCLTEFDEALIRDENMKCCIALSKELAKGRDVNNICKEETQMNKNKFFIRSAVLGADNCSTTHQNANKPKIKISETSILIVIPRKEMAFMQPIGFTKNVSHKDLSKWINQ